MSKKTFYIILIAAAALLIIGGLIGYFVFSKETAPQPVGEVGFTIPGSALQGKIKALSKGPTISANFDSGQNAVLFYDFSGQLWKFSANDSEPVAMDKPPIKNMAEIIWPKVFSPDGKKIVYQKNNSLLVSDSSGKNQRTLVSVLKLKDIILKWPAANSIALISKPSGLVAGGLWVLDVRNLTFSRLLEGLFGLEALYSPNGGRFIYSYADQNGRLKLTSSDNKENKRELNTSTLIDKCVWLGDSLNVLCAAPKSWPEGMLLPDDYYKTTNLTNDDIWKINTETGSKDLMVPNVGDINNLLVDGNENSVYFISRSNQFLYQLNLK